jgi:RNA polymerase sigma factor (sigma-70 family)
VNSAAAARELVNSDERLVRECCRQNPAAWAALIDKYKNLIFSVPIKCGFSREDSADVFQAVCVHLLTGLENLREPKALPKWLIQTTYHECLRWKKHQLNVLDDVDELENQPDQVRSDPPEEMLYLLEREQSVRESMAELPERCNRMVNMLFFEDPPRPYHEVAAELGIATGSIGFIRGRCLKKLRKLLEQRGFR